MAHGPGEASPYTPKRKTKPAKETLRHEIAANVRKQAKLAAQVHVPALPKIGKFKAPPAPALHPKLTSLQAEHAHLTDALGRIQLTVASRQERHPENIPIIGSPNTSTLDALVLAASLAPIGEIAGAGVKAARTGLEGTRVAEATAKAAEAVKTSRVGQAAERVAAKPAARAAEADRKAYYASKLQTPAERAAEAAKVGRRKHLVPKGTPTRTAGEVAADTKAAAKVVVKKTAARAKTLPERAAIRTATAPKRAVVRAARAPFGAESRTARALGVTPAGALGAAATPLKGTYLLKAGSNQLQGFVNDPIKTLHQTARVAEQFPAAAVTPISAAVSSLRSGSLGPLEKFGKQSLDYAKLYADLAGPSGQAITQNQLGLIPLATGLVGGRAVAKGEKTLAEHFGYRTVGKPISGATMRKVKPLHDIYEADPKSKRGQAALAKAKRIVARDEGAMSAAHGRKSASVAEATSRSTQEAGVRRYGIHKVGSVLVKAVRKKAPHDLTEADFVSALGQHSFLGKDKAAVQTAIRRELKRLGPAPKDAAGVHARAVYEAVLADPSIIDRVREKQLPAIQTATNLLQAGRNKEYPPGALTD